MPWKMAWKKIINKIKVKDYNHRMMAWVRGELWGQGIGGDEGCSLGGQGEDADTRSQPTSISLMPPARSTCYLL